MHDTDRVADVALPKGCNVQQTEGNRATTTATGTQPQSLRALAHKVLGAQQAAQPTRNSTPSAPVAGLSPRQIAVQRDRLLAACAREGLDRSVVDLLPDSDIPGTELLNDVQLRVLVRWYWQDPPHLRRPALQHRDQQHAGCGVTCPLNRRRTR